MAYTEGIIGSGTTSRKNRLFSEQSMIGRKHTAEPMSQHHCFCGLSAVEYPASLSKRSSNAETSRRHFPLVPTDREFPGLATVLLSVCRGSHCPSSRARNAVLPSRT